MLWRIGRWLAIGVCALALAAGGIAAQEPTNAPPGPGKIQGNEELDPIRMTVRLGFADRSSHVRVNRWHPVFVELENRYKKKEEGISGFLRVTRKVPVSRVDDTSSITPVELPAGSKKLVVLHEFIEEDDEEMLVELVSGRDVRVSDSVQIADLARTGEGADLFLEVSPRPHALGWLEVRPRSEFKEMELPLRFLMPVDPLELPRAWIGWDALDGILIDDPDTLPLERAQVTALQSFIRLGGTLVVALGKNAPVVSGSALAAILPVEFVSTLTWMPSAEHGPEDLNLSNALADATGRGISIATGIPGVAIAATRGEVLAYAGRNPIAVEERVGLGRIVVLAFAASEPALVREEAAHEFVRRCIGRSVPRLARETYGTTEGIQQPPIVPPYAFPSAPGPAQNVVNFQRGGNYAPPQLQDQGEGGWRDYLEEAFVNDLLTRIPSWKSVFSFLAVYFLVLVPLNYLLFRRLDRLEYAWPASVVIALAFSALAYTVGLRGGATTLTIRQLTVVEAGSGSPEGRATQMLGLASAAHVAGDFRLFGDDRYITRLRTRKDRRGHERETVQSVLDETGVTLRDFRVLARAISGMEMLHLFPLGEGVTARVERGVGRWKVSVQNGTEVELTAPVLLLGDHAVRLANLAAGAKADLTLEDTQAESRNSVLSAWSHGNYVHETFGATSRGVLESLLMNEAKGPLKIALLAMLPDPGFMLRYEGSTLPSFGMTVLVVKPECVLAYGRFDLPDDLWTLRLANGDYSGVEWDASGRGPMLRSAKTELVLEPAIWSADATLETGALSWSLGPNYSAIDTDHFSILCWKPGLAYTRGAISHHGATNYEIPLVQQEVDPATGGIRFLYTDDANMQISPIHVTLQGRRP